MREYPIAKLLESFEVLPSGFLRKRKGRWCGRIVGSINSTGHVSVMVDNQAMLAHRIIFAMTRGRWPAGMLDHINGDPNDNHPENLRECDSATNGWNVGISKSNTSGYKGVSKNWRKNSWRVTMNVRGKFIYIGSFKTAEEAGLAYDCAQDRLRNEFAMFINSRTTA